MTSEATYQLKTDGISAEDFGGELVAVNFTNGKYYGLSGLAPIVWHLLSEPRSLQEIVLELSRKTGADSDIVNDSVIQFLQQMQDEELLLVDQEGALSASLELKSDPASVSNKLTEAFQAPELTVYSDLQELIMLDPVHDADPEHGWPVKREDHLARK